jgi:peptide chain release factor 3
MTFMRICSGKFERDREYFHVQGGKSMRLSQPQQMMADDRQIINEAYAGDIIGVFDPGIFSIGDTVCDPKNKVEFEGIPTFAPEHFCMIEQADSLKRKQFVKGVEQIAQEGAIQIFHEPNSGMERVFVGVVGVLQFDVVVSRLKNEYNVEAIYEPISVTTARWIESDDQKELDDIQRKVPQNIALDGGGNLTYIAPNMVNLNLTMERYKNIKFNKTREH